MDGPVFDHSDRRHGQLHEHFVQGIYTLNQRVTPIGEKLFRNDFVIMKWTNGEQGGYFHIQENKLPHPLEIIFDDIRFFISTVTHNTAKIKSK